jgi:hypothetical protein
MVLRPTAKMLNLLGIRPGPLVAVPPSEDDWYLNLLWIYRRKCLLLMHAGTLFPVFVADVRKADITPVGPCVAELVEEHLRAEGLAAETLGPLDRANVDIAKTASRSVLGVMNQAAVHARYRIEAMGGVDRRDSSFISRYLGRTVHDRDGVYLTPLELVLQRSQAESSGA